MNGTISDVASRNRVLSKNRGCGRILSAPTVWVGKLLPFSERLRPTRFRADSIRPYGLRGKLLPFNAQLYPVGRRVREVPYWYTPRRVIKKTGGGSRLSLQVED